MKSKKGVLFIGITGLIVAVLIALLTETQRFQVIAGTLIALSLVITIFGWASYRREE